MESDLRTGKYRHNQFKINKLYFYLGVYIYAGTIPTGGTHELYILICFIIYYKYFQFFKYL